MLWPFTTGTAGGVWSGHIRLSYRTWPFEYNAKPVLCGRLKDDGGGSSLYLRYRAPVWVYAFFLFWYLFLVLIGAAVFGGNGDTLAVRAYMMGITVWTVLLLAPVVLHLFGTRRSDEDLAAILSFLSDYAEAKR